MNTASPPTKTASVFDSAEVPSSIETPLLQFINDCPALLSLLYDMDWMPEQLKRGTREWILMLLLVEYWKNEFEGQVRA